MPVSKQQKDFYDKNGYLVVESVLTPEECDAYNEEAHRAVGGNVTVTSAIHRISDKYLELLRDPRILDYVDSLQDWRMIPVGSIFFFSKANNPKESGSCPHQDNFAPKAPVGSYLAVGVAFDDADASNGSLVVYPGTHKMGDLPCNPKANFEYDEAGNVTKALPIGNNVEIDPSWQKEQLSYKKGDIVLFHAHLVHWAPKNIAEDPAKEYRRTVYLKYIKNGHPFWPGWTDKRELIERNDFEKGPVEQNLYKEQK